MFLAVVIPAAKEDKAVALVVLASMAGSLAFTYLPLLREISGGTRIIILTIVIAAAAAVIRPVPPEKITGVSAAEEAEKETVNETEVKP